MTECHRAQLAYATLMEKKRARKKQRKGVAKTLAADAADFARVEFLQ
jgi:hypothetical protein